MRELKILCVFAVIVVAGLLSACARKEPAKAASDASAKPTITEAEVNAAQQAWCDGLVKIGKIYKEHGDYKAAASEMMDNAYDFKEGRVLWWSRRRCCPWGFWA